MGVGLDGIVYYDVNSTLKIVETKAHELCF